jgi:hypothetical protein
MKRSKLLNDTIKKERLVEIPENSYKVSSCRKFDELQKMVKNHLGFSLKYHLSSKFLPANLQENSRNSQICKEKINEKLPSTP